jgi:hypothetical protein
VVDRYQFLAIDSKGNIVEDLSEKEIKACLPDIGEPMQFIKGEHKGLKGILIVFLYCKLTNKPKK